MVRNQMSKFVVPVVRESLHLGCLMLVARTLLFAVFICHGITILMIT